MPSTDAGAILPAVLAVEVMGTAQVMRSHNAARTVHIITADISQNLGVTAITAPASIGTMHVAVLRSAIMMAHHDLQVTEVPVAHVSVRTEWPVETTAIIEIMAIIAVQDRRWTGEEADRMKVIASQHGHLTEMKPVVATVLAWRDTSPDAGRSAHRWPSFNRDASSPV